MSVRSPRRLHNFRTLAALVLAGAFYLLLIDTLDSPELYAGAGAVALAVALFESSCTQEGAAIVARPQWWLRAWRVVIRVPGDIVTVSIAALVQLSARRASYGALRAVRFGDRDGGDDDPARAAGRRALAEALGSLTPNTIVLGVDVERGLILAHELRPGRGRDSIDPLGLG